MPEAYDALTRAILSFAQALDTGDQKPPEDPVEHSDRRKWLRAASCLLALGVVAFVVATLPPIPSPAPRDAVIHVILKDDGRLLFNATAIAPADTSYFHQMDLESATCRVLQERENEPLHGTDWAEIGLAKPSSGTEIENEALAAALQHQVTFTSGETQYLGLPNELAPDSFVKARNLKYYRPVARSEVMFIAVSGPVELVTRVDTLVSRSAQETVSHSVDGSLSISNFRAVSRFAMSKEDTKLSVKCQFIVQVRLYFGVISFQHIQGLDQEVGSHDVQQAAAETAQHTNFDSVKETVLDLPNSVSVEPRPLEDDYVTNVPAQGRNESSDMSTESQGLNASRVRDSNEPESSSTTGKRRNSEPGAQKTTADNREGKHLGIHFRPLLPYIQDPSGVIKALYFHIEAGVAVNLTASFVGLGSDTDIDHKNALLDVESFPFTWLLVHGNDTQFTNAEDRNRGRFFCSCAGGCGTHTLRALTVTMMKALTTHPMREIALSAAALPSTSNVFKKLVSDDSTVVKVNLVPERGRRGLAEDKDMCMEMDLLTWRVEGCFQVKQIKKADAILLTQNLF